MVDDAAGRADDDVRALGDGNRLGHHVNAAHEHGAAHADDSPKGLELRAHKIFRHFEAAAGRACSRLAA